MKEKKDNTEGIASRQYTYIRVQSPFMTGLKVGLGALCAGIVGVVLVGLISIVVIMRMESTDINTHYPNYDPSSNESPPAELFIFPE